MNTREIRVRKSNLERTITALLRDFEQETGMEVTDCYVRLTDGSSVVESLCGKYRTRVKDCTIRAVLER